MSSWCILFEGAGWAAVGIGKSDNTDRSLMGISLGMYRGEPSRQNGSDQRSNRPPPPPKSLQAITGLGVRSTSQGCL